MSTTATRDAAFAAASARIDTAIVMVDAETARRWLTRNRKNRRVAQARVARYRSDMQNGRWTFAGDPIRFDAEGNLIDGQHRLLALAELEGVTVAMLVVRGLASEAQRVMDQGGKRSPGDQLALLGIKDSNAVAAAVKQYLIWTEGLLFRDNRVVTAEISTPRIEEWVQAHPDEIAGLSHFLSLTKQNDAPPSVAAAAALGFMRLDYDATVQFFTLLARGAGTVGHPIVTLDKRLQRHRREGIKMTNRDYLSLFIIAWNAWREGREMAKFQRPRGGRWTEENFPVPR